MLGAANVVYVNVVFSNVVFFVNNNVNAVARVVDRVVESLVDCVEDRVEDNVSFVLVVMKSSKGSNSPSLDNWFKVFVSNDKIGESVALIVINIVGLTSEIIVGVCNVVDKFVFTSCV